MCSVGMPALGFRGEGRGGGGGEGREGRGSVIVKI